MHPAYGLGDTRTVTRGVGGGPLARLHQPPCQAVSPPAPVLACSAECVFCCSCERAALLPRATGHEVAPGPFELRYSSRARSDAFPPFLCYSRACMLCCVGAVLLVHACCEAPSCAGARWCAMPLRAKIQLPRTLGSETAGHAPLCSAAPACRYYFSHVNLRGCSQALPLSPSSPLPSTSSLPVFPTLSLCLPPFLPLPPSPPPLIS